MAVGGMEADLGGRRWRRGLSFVAVDEKVVGAAPTRWKTTQMKGEDAMQGSRSGIVDERGRSLVMDSGVGVSAPAWWRRTAADGVADGGGRRRVGWHRNTGGGGRWSGRRPVQCSVWEESQTRKKKG